jgi:hypothetical protein
LTIANGHCVVTKPFEELMSDFKNNSSISARSKKQKGIT